MRCHKLAVDGVLIIGEHGNYPKSEYGQTKYPRYEKRTCSETQTVCYDKIYHGSGNGQGDGRHFRELNFFTAGSSLPVTWRMPAIDMPYGAEVEELLAISIGSIDS